MANRNERGQFVRGHENFSKKGKRPNFHGNSGSFRKGKTPYNKGKQVPKTIKEKISLKLKSYFKTHTNVNKGKGNGKENELQRHREEYKLWRKSVFERDNFTCQKYGTRGGRIVAHHINNFADFPELRLAIDNGITLSEKAHKEFHKLYGRKNNTKEQLNEFLEQNG